MRIFSLMVVGGVFSVSVGLAAEPTPATNIVARRLVEMFNAGFARGANPLKGAQRHYDAARQEAKGDPRVDYGFGLVLLKQLRNKEAIAQFQSVTKSQPEFWQAWQALIWCHFVGKDQSNYPQGYSFLREFARRLVASQAELSERQQSVEWIGQVIAALQKSADTAKQREALLREDEALAEILGADLTSSFAKGKANVNMLHSLVEEEVQQTREQSKAKEEKERLERENQVAKDLEESTKNRELLKKSAEEAKKAFDQQIEAIDKQLVRLERDYDLLQKRLLAITTSQVQINTEMALLSQQLSGNAARPNPAVANAYEQRRAVLQAQSIRYTVELDQTAMGSMMVSQKAQTLVGQRMATVQQFERSTGQIVQKDASLDKWQDRLKKEGEKLKAPAKGKPASLVNKIQAARSFRTYVDLDLALERDRILDSYGVDVADVPDAK